MGAIFSAAAAKADSAGLLPRLQPRPLGICYSPTFNEPADVEAEAVYRCGEGGRLVRQDEDFFWNGCSLTQPHRVNYVCYPPDKAKRPVEFHLYQNGGHGFGLGNPNRTSNRWFEAFIHWLDVNGFLAPEAGK
mgnify:CR=1 FL=1